MALRMVGYACLLCVGCGASGHVANPGSGSPANASDAGDTTSTAPAPAPPTQVYTVLAFPGERALDLDNDGRVLLGSGAGLRVLDGVTRRQLAFFGVRFDAASFSFPSLVAGNSLDEQYPTAAVVRSDGSYINLSKTWCGQTYTCDNDGVVGVTDEGEVFGNRLLMAGKGQEPFVANTSGTSAPLTLNDGTVLNRVISVSKSGYVLASVGPTRDSAIHLYVRSPRKEWVFMGTDLSGVAVNNLGHVVGTTLAGNAFVWDGRSLKLLGAFAARAMNDDDDVLGDSQTTGRIWDHTVIKWSHGQMTDLSTAAYPNGGNQLTVGLRLSNSGAILAVDWQDEKPVLLVPQ
jgi:hypothetical protein